MFKNLNPSAVGISARQSELIELALTTGFRGLDLEVDDFLRRAKNQGLAQTIQFIASARISIGGFELPVEWRGDEETYKAQLAEFEGALGFAKDAKVHACLTHVLPESDYLPYHENFELHRTRLAEISEVLGKHNIRLAVGYYAAQSRRGREQFQFIHEADALSLLLKSVPGDNVGLLLDTWDWYVGGGTVDSLNGLGVNDVAYVRIADAPADADRESLSEEQRQLHNEEGTTSIDEIARALKEGGYKGPVTVAAHRSCFDGMNGEAIARKCNEVLTAIWKVAEEGPIAS
ncbi:MAG: hypothetical protein CMJ64_07255 [Planctomycetaceae bacterium]|nr:hypothetical protein [Planctomycetaceae bacterium]